ncbi:hypothetical protein AAV94_09610 [Lampropedia cohaerens]|uniref:Zinc-dependent peptidase n=1 Tax=Lampropedia cohaerens TaxID=1610491 RepID=A0A0U1PYQ3_9BURK|nr:M90 family metallopeptidase [Lampropedia cohaerens]KKW67606.1 hypothetical protein AAV94_09610 [Lampropedia cohaerens]
MFRWLLSKGASRRKVKQVQQAIDVAMWQAQIDAMPFLRGLTVQELAHLKALSAWILASKTFDGAAGLEVTDAMALCIAIQAALPILELGPQWYEGWTGIIVYPGSFIPRHHHIDTLGVVHPRDDEHFGESWQHGPVILSWQAAHAHDARMNVVIHEFAHKLDMAHSEPDGMPPLAGSGIAPREWEEVLESAWRRFVRMVEIVEAAIPSDVDPESPEGRQHFDALPMDAYAATDPAEFFAVSSEVFFIDPQRLCNWHPAWYALLVRFYRQDPARRLERAGKTSA